MSERPGPVWYWVGVVGLAIGSTCVVRGPEEATSTAVWAGIISAAISLLWAEESS